MRTITLQEVKESLAKIITENPDRRVAYCQYTNYDGAPECVVGVVLHDLGAPRPEHNSEANQNGFRLIGRGWMETRGVNLESDACELLAQAQEIQDRVPNLDGIFAGVDEGVGLLGTPWIEIAKRLGTVVTRTVIDSVKF